MFTKFIAAAAQELQNLLPTLTRYTPRLEQLGQAMLSCWGKNGKILLAGNGGSMADAMHFAEELTIRFHKNRRALAAVALSDVTALTCAGNDFGYDVVFSRQIEALGNAGDILVVFSTSGNSKTILAALEAGKSREMLTCAFLGRGGGAAAGRADIELIVDSDSSARIQEIHQVLFHIICQWVDEQFPTIKL
ncbi:MAG: SIS domain-containing protein [Phycisphaerales bacterium]|nr:SIS domain-containing protein [Phycisphaerales bacterium]